MKHLKVLTQKRNMNREKKDVRQIYAYENICLNDDCATCLGVTSYDFCSMTDVAACFDGSSDICTYDYNMEYNGQICSGGHHDYCEFDSAN